MSHKQPPQNPYFHHICQRCKEGFPIEILLTEHLKGQICHFVDLKPQEPMEPEDGITPEMDRLLSARNKSCQVMTWQSLWRLLFPQDENIPSPGKCDFFWYTFSYCLRLLGTHHQFYAEFVPPDTLEDIRQSFHHHERDLEQQLNHRLSTAMSTDNSDILQLIRSDLINIFRDHVNTRLSACKGRRGKSLRGEPTRRAYRTTPLWRKRKSHNSNRGDGLTSVEDAQPQGPSTRLLAPTPRSNEGTSSIAPPQTSNVTFQAGLANQTGGLAPQDQPSTPNTQSTTTSFTALQQPLGSNTNETALSSYCFLCHDPSLCFCYLSEDFSSNFGNGG